MSQKTGQLFSSESLVALFGINGVINMVAFGIQKFLVTLPPEQKFMIFWLGALISSAAAVYGIFHYIGKKKTNLTLIGGVVAIGIVAMVLASPIVAYFFPINPTEAGFALGVETPLPLAPISLALIAFGGYYIYHKKR